MKISPCLRQAGFQYNLATDLKKSNFPNRMFIDLRKTTSIKTTAWHAGQFINENSCFFLIYITIKKL